MRHTQSRQTAKPSIGQNVLKLVASRLAIQVLAFLTIPILTRLFTPAHFGVVQIFDSLSRLVVILTCLKYDMSIPLARTDQEAVASVGLSAMLAIGISLLLVPFVSLGGGTLAIWLKAPGLRQFLWLLPPLVLLASLTNILEFWLMRERRFGAIAWAHLGNFATDRSIALFWAGVLGASPVGLFTAHVAGVVAGTGLLLWFAHHRLSAAFRHAPLTRVQLWSIAARHKKFPLFNTGSVFLNTLSTQLPFFFLGGKFSMNAVGYYALAQRVINLPITMLSDTIANVFFAEGAKAYHEQGTLTLTVHAFFLRLTQIGMLPLTVLSLFGPFLFTLVFGQKWSEAGVYAQMLSFWYCLVFISLPKIFIILNRQEVNLLLNILNVIVRAASLLIGVAVFASSRIAIGMFTAAGMGLVIIAIIWQLKLAQVSLRWAFGTVMRYLALAYLLLMPARIILSLTRNSFSALSLLALGTLGYGFLLLKSDATIRNRLLRLCERRGIPTGALHRIFTL